MPYAFVQDIAASWEHYGRFAAALEGSAPDGLILHAAGPTDEGFRIIGIWENEGAWQSFRDERLDADTDAVVHIAPIFRALKVAHLVHPGGTPHAAAGVGARSRTHPESAS
jgi:hypothetical protein